MYDMDIYRCRFFAGGGGKLLVFHMVLIDQPDFGDRLFAAVQRQQIIRIGILILHSVANAACGLFSGINLTITGQG